MGEDAAAFPELVEFLTLEKFADGTSRMTGSLLIFVQDGRLKVMFSDREEDLVAFRSFDSLDGLLVACNQDIKQDLLDWRKNRGGGGKRR
jgi:hypothetical protein